VNAAYGSANDRIPAPTRAGVEHLYRAGSEGGRRRPAPATVIG